MTFTFYIIFLFIIYSFIGWIIEKLYSFYTKNTLKNKGFLYGPLKPMYGIAMATLVIIYEIFHVNKILMLLLCFFLPSLVEYLSGYLLDHFFNKCYWDYSNLKYNLHGYVCLKFSLYWTFLSWIGVIYIHPVIKYYYKNNINLIHIFLLFSSFIFIIDIFSTLNHYYHKL